MADWHQVNVDIWNHKDVFGMATVLQAAAQFDITPLAKSPNFWNNSASGCDEDEYGVTFYFMGTRENVDEFVTELYPLFEKGTVTSAMFRYNIGDFLMQPDEILTYEQLASLMGRVVKEEIYD